MYEALYAPIPDVNAYLDRLGLTSHRAAAASALNSTPCWKRCCKRWALMPGR